MTAYLARRLILVSALFGIMVINFVVVQFVWRSVEQMIATLSGEAVSLPRGSMVMGMRGSSTPHSNTQHAIGRSGITA